MIKYYTRACNFYYGNSSKKLVKPLHKIIAISGLILFVISKKILADLYITNSQGQMNLEATLPMLMSLSGHPYYTYG